VPNIIYLPSALGAIKTHLLHDVDNDTTTYPYAAPSAIASITGEPLSRVRDAVRLVRFGAGWVHRSRSPIINYMSDTDIEETMRALGYVGEWHDVAGCPTLAAYLKHRTGVQKSHPCIVFLTTHCVAVSGDLFCGPANNGLMIDIDRAPGRRKRVNGVFVITHRIAAAHIPSKAPSRKKPDHRTAEEKRMAKERDRLFREAVKAETGATRIMVTATEVFIIRPADTGWTWCGARDGVADSLLKLQEHGWIGGNTDEAAAYRTAMGYQR